MMSSSPASKLAVEILDIIFGLVQSSSAQGTEPYQTRGGPGLRECRLVCKKWNDAIISIPRLWSTIPVIRARGGDEGMIAGVETCLKRSHPLPAELIFNKYACMLYASALDLDWKRVVSVRIGEEGYHTAVPFLARVMSPSAFPNLNKLTIETDIYSRCKELHNINDDDDEDRLTLLPLLQQLTSLEVRGLCMTCSSIPQSTGIRALASLTRLNLDPVSANRTELRTIFSAAPNLEILALGIHHFRLEPNRRTTSAKPKDIRAPKSLHSPALQFRSLQDPTCSCAIGQIHAPGLKYLEIGGRFPNPSSDPHPQEILKAITASHCLSRVRIHINGNATAPGGELLKPNAHWPSTLSSALSHPVDVEIVSTTSPSLTGLIPGIFYSKNIRTLTFNTSPAFANYLAGKLRQFPAEDSRVNMAPVAFRIFGVNTPSAFQTEELHATISPFLQSGLSIYWAGEDVFQSDGGLLSRDQVFPVPKRDIREPTPGAWWEEFASDSEDDSELDEEAAFIMEYC